MKTTVDLAAFKSALNTVRGAVASRTALPILANVLIDADGDRLTLRATDLKVAVSRHLNADIDEPWQAAVDARLLWEFVANLPDTGSVTITLDHQRFSLRLKSGGNDARFNGTDPRDYPTLPSLKPEVPTFTVPAEVLGRALRLVPIGAAQDESRPVLAGISFRADGSDLAFAASDGFVMAHYAVPVEGLPATLDILPPATTLAVLAGILPPDGDVTVQVAANRSHVIFAWGDTVWSSQLIEGTFPDIRQVIPREHRTRIELDGDILHRAVKLAQAFAQDNNRVIRFAGTPSADDLTPGTLKIHGHAAERGEGESLLDVVYEGDPIEIAFDAKYLLAVLRAMNGGGRVALATNGKDQAGKLGGSAAPGFTFVMMPMTIKERV